MRSTDHLPTFRKKKQRKKLLRGLIYFSPIMAMFCLVTAVYIASYYERSNDTEETPGTVVQAGQRENESEQNQGNGILEANPLQNGAENMGGAGTMIPEKSAERQESVDQNKHDTTSLETSSEAMAADDSTDIYITPRMTYTLEIYDARTGQLTTENPPIPNAMYGLNRMELEQYLTQLASVENERQGEIQHHYQVTSFSRRAFTVRQTITEHQEEYAIFLIAENGYLTAYTGDRTSVYEHTQISLGDFPLEQQAMLTRGIYMKTLTDYYDFLETYSS